MSSPWSSPPELSDDNDFDTEVVGESFRQPELRALEARVAADSQGRRTFVATLRADPDNPADKNAVVVLAADNADPLGYLSREMAAIYHGALRQHDGAEVPAILLGGSERKPSFGVRLDLTALNRVLGIEQTETQPDRRSGRLDLLRRPDTVLDPSGSAQDPYGQPLNVRFNRARRAERDLCELLGLARGLLADGNVSASEATLLRDWVGRHPDALEHWAVRTVHQRLVTHFEDGVIDDAEREDLKLLLDQLVSGELSAVCNTDAATTLPLDRPPPTIEWLGMTYVFTGKFAFGTRRDCEREVEKRGGIPESNITRRTSFLVIGTFGSIDWVHSAFGRKIEKAVSYRDAGALLRIVAEDHWARSLA